MAWRIVWTENADTDRQEIFDYWINRTNSLTYSKKLHRLIKENTKLISQYPYIGRLTDEDNIRVKIIGDYLLFYEISVTHIIILKLWDSRRNPHGLSLVNFK